MRQTTIRGIDDNRKVGTGKPSLDDMFMYTSCIRIDMAKLYWRMKKKGKWTWRAAKLDKQYPDEYVVIPMEEE